MKGVIAIANHKGGVLKTTTTHNLGAGLAQKGYRVLTIDLDPQASLTISMGKEPMESEANIYDIFNGKLAARECICQVGENLDLIPSSTDLAVLEMQLFSRTARETILDRAMRDIRESYDYILIDCPPQLSILAINGLSMADAVIIPSKTDYISYRPIEQLLGTIGEIQRLINPKIYVMGVIASLFEKKVSEHKEVLEVMEENYNVIGIVKKTAEATKGIYSGQAVISWNPKAEISGQYWKIIEYIEET